MVVLGEPLRVIAGVGEAVFLVQRDEVVSVVAQAVAHPHAAEQELRRLILLRALPGFLLLGFVFFFARRPVLVPGGCDQPGLDMALACADNGRADRDTVVAGCKTAKSIAKRVGLSPGALCAYNGGMGMLPSSTLRVGTELWVSAPALEKVRREVGGEKTSD